MAWLWFINGDFAEGERWLGDALGAPGPQQTELAAIAHVWHGYCVGRSTDPAGGVIECEHAVAVLRAGRDQAPLAKALVLWATVLCFAHQFARRWKPARAADANGDPATQLLADTATAAVKAIADPARRHADAFVKVRDIPGEHPWGPGATSTAEWTGVSLAEVLRAAGPPEPAAHVAFAAPDVSCLADPPQPYGGSIPLAKALAGEVLLAWAMNGQPLPAAHGAPVRVVVPGYIGARSIKWVQRITVCDVPSGNYFQATAYRLLPAEMDPDAAGPGEGLSLGAVAVNADILRPGEGAILTAGPVTVCGYAFAGDDRGIARVDVSVDDGRSWRQADLGEDAGPWAWRLWHVVIDVPPGEQEIIARAWDTCAAVQPESPVHLWNPKGYVNNSWARLPVTAR